MSDWMVPVDPEETPHTASCHAFAAEYLNVHAPGGNAEELYRIGEAVAEVLTGWTAGTLDDMLPHLERIYRLRAWMDPGCAY